MEFCCVSANERLHISVGGAIIRVPALLFILFFVFCFGLFFFFCFGGALVHGQTGKHVYILLFALHIDQIKKLTDEQNEQPVIRVNTEDSVPAYPPLSPSRISPGKSQTVRGSVMSSSGVKQLTTVA